MIKTASYRGARNVRQVGSDTGRVHDIVEGELGDVLAGLEEERQWLDESIGVLEL